MTNPKEEIIKLLSRDPVLAAIIPEITLPEPQPRQDVFNALIRSIVSQQLSTKAAATIYQRFAALFEGNEINPTRILSTDEQVLRSAGLSKQKSTYLKEVADFFSGEAENMDWQQLSDEQIVKDLTRIKGVGVWTVQMILMFHMARPDVFPVDDLGIQQSMADLYGITAEKQALKKQMLRIADNWRPYRSYASRYLWKWRDNFR